MSPEEIRYAIRERKRLYFCENQSGSVKVVECIPIEMEMIGPSPVVGVFIQAGVRVMSVDAFLLEETIAAAATTLAKKHEILSRLSAAVWRHASNEVSISKLQMPAGNMGPGSGMPGGGMPGGGMTN